MLDRHAKRMQRSVYWKLLHAGFVTLSYTEAGHEMFTVNPECTFTEDESAKVHRAIIDAGQKGATCPELAAVTGLSLVKVRCIIGDYPQ